MVGFSSVQLEERICYSVNQVRTQVLNKSIMQGKNLNEGQNKYKH